MQLQTHRVHIENRNYSSWKYIDISTNLPTENTELGSPLSLRVFHGDEIQHSQIINSPVRTSPYIAGVLLIENNRTYGRSCSNKRLLYKCIPDNASLPAFLVPYEISLKFSKKIVNKYVLFRFNEWKDKHPVGVLTETIGDVTDNAAFCEYRLCCRNLRQNAKIKKEIESRIQMEEKRTYLENIIQNSKYCVKDRTRDYVIAIDPEGSRDYDDAFSCKIIGDSQCVISIHISNVVLWLDHLKLWEFLKNIANVSTVYLPNKRLPMFPPILSENLCSLTADGEKRIAFTLDITLDRNGTILATEFSNTAISVCKNYVYESAECLANPTYRILYEMAVKRDAHNIKDSHDVVAYWMMQMNHIAGDKLANCKTGIFRKAEKRKKESESSVGIPDDISQNTRRILQLWDSVVSAEYCTYMENMPIDHCVMGLQNYVHITSPIRRLVDIVNQIALMVALQLAELSEDVCIFLKENMQIAKIEYINENSRAIKKTQQECDTLYKIAENPGIIDESWRGIILNIDEERGQAIAYLEDLNLMISVGIDGNENIEKYNYYMFCVYVFEDEYKIRMKLRWTICD